MVHALVAWRYAGAHRLLGDCGDAPVDARLPRVRPARAGLLARAVACDHRRRSFSGDILAYAGADKPKPHRALSFSLSDDVVSFRLWGSSMGKAFCCNWRQRPALAHGTISALVLHGNHQGTMAGVGGLCSGAAWLRRRSDLCLWSNAELPLPPGKGAAAPQTHRDTGRGQHRSFATAAGHRLQRACLGSRSSQFTFRRLPLVALPRSILRPRTCLLLALRPFP